MVNILTAEQGADIVGADPEDTRLLLMLPQVDAAVEEATGRDWTQDTPIHPIAQRAAMCRLAIDYDLGAMLPQQNAVMERAYVTACAQLETIAVGIAALATVNAISQSPANETVYIDDMLDALSNGALGLNLKDFNRLSPTGRRGVAQTILAGRPAGGYAGLVDLQAALDAAVREALP